MNKIQKILLSLTFLTLSLAASSAIDNRSNSEEGPFPSGLWLLYWEHSPMEMTDEKGNSSTEYMWTPGSYGFMGEIQYDSYYYFREDFTGVFFRRIVKMDEDAEQFIAVVSEEGSDNYIEKDVLYYRDNFSWDITGDVISLYFEMGILLTQKEQDYQYLHHRVPERTAGIDASPEGLQLRDELVILHLGQMRRVGPDQVSDFLERYSIEP